MSEKLNRFVNLLEGIFELDKADLDFGIYRIMNIRRNQIEEFLSEGLPKRVQETLKPFAEDTSALTARITEIEKQCDAVGMDVAKSKMADEYGELKSKLARGVDLSSIEADVYSALFSFFNRYYDEGDFISKRRYKEGVYAIPYEGEEVKLYWANADQYYIKTAENFRDYTFVDDGKKIHFRLVDATTENNNNKEPEASKRVFMLYTETPDKPEVKTIEEVDGELIIHFIYDVPADKSIKYAETNLAAIINAIQKDFKGWLHLLRPAHVRKGKDDVSIIEKHLTAYVAKNTFDYFIHKDLRGFLTRELDFFIKSEVIHLDDIDTTDEKRAESYLAKVRAIKRVGKVIIDFLAQIEDFQKKLWLKKKFVVATNWCITLDRIDESFYPEIIANAAQVTEWRDICAIDEIAGNLTTAEYSELLTVEFLRQNGSLVLDTRHFSADFKDRLVASIDNLDEQTSGLMIHSENFQALRLLTERYENKVQEVFIDPPFNLKQNGDFLYRTDYKDSTWLTILENRIRTSRSLLSRKGLFLLRCDINGNSLVRQLCNDLFGDDLFEAELLVQRIRKNVTDQGKITLPLANDSIFVYANSKETVYVNPYKKLEKTRQAYWRRIDDSAGFRNPPERNIFGKIFAPYKHEAHFKFSQTTIEQMISEKRIRLLCKDCKHEHYEGVWDSCPNCGSNSCTPQYQVLESDEMVLDTNWLDLPGYSSNWGFSTENALPLIQRAVNLGSYDDSLVLDYFAGSGTTGHAVINLNREDDGNRKYILVEMGEYFHTVTLPRMKKVVYSNEWKSGKPQNRNTGVSHIMKYVKLESYEDALSNVTLDDSMNAQLSLLGDEYLINYMFSYESRDSLLRTDDFRDPFAYKLNISENNETKERVIDLCETFNYLLGLRVTSQSAVKRFDAAVDNKEYEGSVTLTSGSDPSRAGEFSFKQYEGKLPDGRRALVIWRTVTDDILRSNAALDAYFTKHRINPADREYDVIYVNCDNNLENLRGDNEEWKVQRIEPLFKAKMFEEE